MPLLGGTLNRTEHITTDRNNTNMKISTALLLSVCLMSQDGVFAAEVNVADKAAVKKVAYDPAAEAGMQPGKSAASNSCSGIDCVTLQSTNSCGAYVSSRTRHGYGFGQSKAEATSKAREMCGPGNNCQVVVAACED